MATKTGELNKRQLQALETKRLLLETGRALIAERGIEHVTAEDIVSVAGVAKGTFFFHFGSMGNFIMSLSKMNEPSIEEALEATRGLPLMQRLETFVDGWMETLTSFGVGLVSQLITHVVSDAGYRNDFTRNCIHEILAQAKESGELPEDFDADACESFLYTHLMGVSCCWCNEGGQTSLTDYRDVCLRTVKAILPAD